MARPVGTPSHWWKTRKAVTVYLYNATDEDIRFVRDAAQTINGMRRAQSMGEQK